MLRNIMRSDISPINDENPLIDNVEGYLSDVPCQNLTNATLFQTFNMKSFLFIVITATFFTLICSFILNYSSD